MKISYYLVIGRSVWVTKFITVILTELLTSNQLITHKSNISTSLLQCYPTDYSIKNGTDLNRFWRITVIGLRDALPETILCNQCDHGTRHDELPIAIGRCFYYTGTTLNVINGLAFLYESAISKYTLQSKMWLQSHAKLSIACIASL